MRELTTHELAATSGAGSEPSSLELDGGIGGLGGGGAAELSGGAIGGSTGGSLETQGIIGGTGFGKTLGVNAVGNG